VKFLIDNNISRRICPHIEAAGHEAVHVEALSMADADDDEILERARESGAVVVSSDTAVGHPDSGGVDVASCWPGGPDRGQPSFVR
jgi:predicted nuclease of predicted toxin-antitoxin system